MQEDDTIRKYGDILNLPHHTSPKHPRMTAIERAAQFSPFAALTGYDAATKETARVTDRRVELDESEKELLNHRLQLLIENYAAAPQASITYFVPDLYKEGGAYRTVSGVVKRLDSYERQIVLFDGERIALDAVVQIESDLFDVGMGSIENKNTMF